MSTHIPCVLAIGGLDPSGGGGLPADARAIAAFGAHPCLVTTAVIAQNTQGVTRFESVSGEMLQAQLENLTSDIVISAIKIGVLPTCESVEVVCNLLRKLPDKIPVVFDPVLAPSSGPSFSGDNTIEIIQSKLLQLCHLITPNIGEAQRLSHIEIKDETDIEQAAKFLCNSFGAHAALIKGGHSEGHDSVDILFGEDKLSEFRAPRIGGYEVRGTGCLLASAVAAQLAQNIELETAVYQSKLWLTEKIRSAQPVGKGRRIAI